jgi:hypothetical protein
MRQARSAAEVARIDTALAAADLRVSRLHRWCWRLGLALPPEPLMPFFPYLIWRLALTAVVVPLTWSALWLLTQVPAHARLIPTILVSLLVLGMMVKGLLLVKRPGAQLIAALLLAVTGAGIWIALMLFYLDGASFHFSTWRDWLGNLYGFAIFLAWPWQRQRHRGPARWADVWHGRSPAEIF